MTTNPQPEGFSSTPHLSRLYDAYRTVNYGALCAYLFHVERFPEPERTVRPSEANSWLYPEQAPVIDEEEEARIVIGGWNSAYLLPYRETVWGMAYFAEHFDNKWFDEEVSNARIDDAITDLVTLSEGVVQRHLNRFLELADRLASFSTPFWPEVFTSEGDRLIMSYYPFIEFSHRIALDFKPINEPPIKDNLRLAIGYDFLKTYEAWAAKRVEQILYFIRRACLLTDVKPTQTMLAYLQPTYIETNEKEIPAPIPQLQSPPKQDRQVGGPKKEDTQEKNHINFTFFRQEVRAGINEAMQKGREPDQKAICKAAMGKTCLTKKVGHEKLRKDITPAKQGDEFGKIYREEMEAKNQPIRQLTPKIGIK